MWAFLLIGCADQPILQETAVFTPTSLSTPIARPSPTLLSQTAVPPTPLSPQPQLTALSVPTAQPPIATVPPAATNSRRGADETYDFRQWAGFDGIPPIYHPEFVAAEGAPLAHDDLIMGVTLGGEAKAYPISVLQFREMVNDELAGIPILVSW